MRNREQYDFSETMLAYEDVRDLFVTPNHPKGISRRTFDNWIRMGLEAWRFGGLVRTTREALERFSILQRSDEEFDPPIRHRHSKEAIESRARAMAELGCDSKGQTRRRVSSGDKSVARLLALKC
jgi:hypothetical protein